MEQHVEEMFAEWVYRVAVDMPINRDAMVLTCLRNRVVDGEWENEVLTLRGWQRYHEMEVLPGDLPEMSRLDVRRDQQAMTRLVEQVRGLLEATGAEDIRVL